MYASDNTMLNKKRGRAEPDCGVRVAEARVHHPTNNCDQSQARVLVRKRPRIQLAQAHGSASGRLITNGYSIRTRITGAHRRVATIGKGPSRAMPSCVPSCRRRRLRADECIDVNAFKTRLAALDENEGVSFDESVDTLDAS